MVSAVCSGAVGSGRLHERPVSRLHRGDQRRRGHQEAGLRPARGVGNTWTSVWWVHLLHLVHLMHCEPLHLVLISLCLCSTDMIRRRSLRTRAIKMLVLDEADEMLNKGNPRTRSQYCNITAGEFVIKTHYKVHY